MNKLVDKIKLTSILATVFREKEFGSINSRDSEKLLAGYNKIKQKNDLELIQRLRDELYDTPINGKSLEYIFKNPVEICFHQNLCYRRISKEFIKEILESEGDSNKKINYGLPRKWRTKLKKQGYSFSIFSQLNWILFKQKWLLVGFYFGIIEIINYFKEDNIPKNNYSHLIGALKTNISSDIKQYNIVNWLMKQKELSNCYHITHCNLDSQTTIKSEKEIRYISQDIPSIDNKKSLTLFIIWFFFNFFKGLISINNNNLIFLDRIRKKIFELSSDKKIAKYYFFNNQYSLVRPLWTYSAEQRNIKIILYFYSTNNVSLKFKNKVHKQQFNWKYSNWPEYWIWNKNQLDFLNFNLNQKFLYKIKGSIPFSDSKWVDSKESFINSILVYDVQPANENYYPLIGMQDEYYTFNTSYLFLNDLLKFSKNLNLNIHIKRKRNSKTVCKNYINYFNDLVDKNKNWHELDPGLSSFITMDKLKPKAVICTPYTSTAVIAKEKGIPVIYYDPTNSLEESFYADNGINLIQNIHELEKWYGSL